MMRVPLTLNKQGQPVLAGDSSLSFKMNKTAAVVVKETPSCDVAAVIVSACVPTTPAAYCRELPDTITFYGNYLDAAFAAASFSCTGNITSYNLDNTPNITWDVVPNISVPAANISANNIFAGLNRGKIFIYFGFSWGVIDNCSPPVSTALMNEIRKNTYIDMGIATVGPPLHLAYVDQGFTMAWEMAVPMVLPPSSAYYFGLSFAREDGTLPTSGASQALILTLTPVIYKNCASFVFPPLVFQITV